MWTAAALGCDEESSGDAGEGACAPRSYFRSVLLCRYEFCNPLTHALHVRWQLQPASVFNQRNQLVEVRSRVRTNQHDPHRMKQIFALRASLCLDLIHDRLETLRRQ